LACYKSIRFISSIFPPTPRRPFKGSQAASGSVRYLRPPAFHPQNLLGYSIAAVKALCKKESSVLPHAAPVFNEGSGDEAYFI